MCQKSLHQAEKLDFKHVIKGLIQAGAEDQGCARDGHAGQDGRDGRAQDTNGSECQERPAHEQACALCRRQRASIEVERRVFADFVTKAADMNASLDDALLLAGGLTLGLTLNLTLVATFSVQLKRRCSR